MTVLAILDDVTAWDRASNGEREAAISAAIKRLGERFALVRTATYSCGGVSHSIATIRHETGIELQLLPGGRYVRGAREERQFDDAYNWWSEDKVDYENSRALVADELVGPFAIGRTPVTNAQWARLTDDEGAGDGSIRTHLRWADARKALAAKGLVLPSDAEWEWACRGGTTTRFFWGDEPDPTRCVCERAEAALQPDEATTNAFGLVGMLGTVWEWVNEQPVCTYRWKRDLSQDPKGDEGEDHYRILRGGSWRSDFIRCRSASFSYVLDGEADDVGDDVGVRVAVPLMRDYRPAAAYRTGERIVHSRYGEGVVLCAGGRRIEVQFADGKRQLVQNGK